MLKNDQAKIHLLQVRSAAHDTTLKLSHSVPGSPNNYYERLTVSKWFSCDSKFESLINSVEDITGKNTYELTLAPKICFRVLNVNETPAAGSHQHSLNCFAAALSVSLFFSFIHICFLFLQQSISSLKVTQNVCGYVKNITVQCCKLIFPRWSTSVAFSCIARCFFSHLFILNKKP